MFYYSKISVILLFYSILLALALFPIANSINFVQNDEYIYYPMVTQFLTGDFTLHPYVSATFYMQGFMAMPFAYLFGLHNLPVLTLLVSVASFYIFSLTIYKLLTLKDTKKDLKKQKSHQMRGWQALLLGHLLFLNPLFVYSMWGFMTENYFMLFLLLSLYWYVDYEQTQRIKSLLVTNVFIFLGYLVRQFSLVMPVALIIYFGLTRNKKAFLIQLVSTALLLIFHFFVFPITPYMHENSFNFAVFSNNNMIFSLIFTFFIYIIAFTLPLVVILPFQIMQKSTLKLKVAFVILAVTIFFICLRYFSAKYTHNGEFPYLDNIFTRRGFFTNNILGDKPTFYGFFKLFITWDYLAKAGVALFIATLIFKVKKSINVYLIYLGGFALLMLISPVLYDRYLLPMYPVFILLMLTLIDFNKLATYITGAFVVFLFLISYQYSMDFILTHNYVWGRAQQLSVEQNIEKKHIDAGHAWRAYYFEGIRQRERTHVFRYDLNHNLVESYEIKFPLSFFNKTHVYFERRTRGL